MDLADWRPAPNIGRHPRVYERENEALARDGRLDAELARLADVHGRVLLDVGCGTGFWLPRWPAAARVIGVEPDPALLDRARDRVADHDHIEVLHGSAEHLPVPDHSVDVAHARFAYFFGPGSEAGLAEVGRVLKPGGTFLAVDNSWGQGDFADLLRDSTIGNAAIDPGATAAWWADRGATRHEVAGGWAASSPEELESILRIEFPGPTVDRWVGRNPGRAALSYDFAVFVWRAPA